MDVDTGFWLWVAALPLMVTGYIIDLVGTANPRLPTAVLAISVLFVVVLAAVVLTFLILMRHGYRWARTLLTGGGVATIVYVATNLFTVDRPTARGGDLRGQRHPRSGADRRRCVPVAPQGRPRVLHAVKR